MCKMNGIVSSPNCSSLWSLLEPSPGRSPQFYFSIYPLVHLPTFINRNVKLKSTKAVIVLYTIASESSRQKNSAGALAIAPKARR